MLPHVLREIRARFGLRALLWGAALTALALVLSALPLFDVLGYDFSFAIGLVTALAAVDIGHGTVVAARRTSRSLGLLPLTGWALAGALGVLVLPLVMSLANALRIKNCNLASGLAFFALLPVATALFAATAGVLASVVFPRRGRWVAFALPLFSVGWTLLRLYRDPAVFAFDPFGGYFPGPIYDEALRAPARLLWYRLANLLWAGTGLALVAFFSAGGAPASDGPPRVAAQRTHWCLRCLPVLLPLLVGSMVVFHCRGKLGFHLRHGDLQAVLSHRSDSPHFALYTDPTAGQTAEDLALVHRDLEFRYDQLVRILGTTPPGIISVYQFPSAGAKKELVGAGNTLYAKPWMREIFVQIDRFPASRLRHELAHVFAAGFGDPLFGVSFAWRFVGPLPIPRLASGLIEGIAEAADYGDPDGRSTVHQEAQAMVAAGNAPPLAQVLGAGFTGLSGARAYTIAGSFTHFLLATRGPERLRTLYRSAGNFQRAYGESLDTLEKEWRAFLARQPLDPAERANAAERFRRPAIFHKVCARELAARVAEARGRMYSAPEHAVALLESACQDDPSEPTFRLDLADALAAAGQPARALSIAASVESRSDMTWPLRARAASLAATIHYHAHRFAESEAAIRRAQAVATDEGEERTYLAKLRALADDRSRTTLGRVLFGDAPARAPDAALSVYLLTQFARAFPDEALSSYLLARQLTWRDPRLALPAIDAACGPSSDAKVPLPALMQRECKRMMGESAFRAGDLARAQSAYEHLAAEATSEADRLRAHDFLDRIIWDRTHR